MLIIRGLASPCRIAVQRVVQPCAWLLLPRLLVADRTLCFALLVAGTPIYVNIPYPFEYTCAWESCSQARARLATSRLAESGRAAPRVC
eukprot:1933824-Pleurochrysis_carterae.AAC.2